MVTIQDKALKEGISEGIEKAKNSTAPVLVSEVQKINPIAPLSFLSAGRGRFQGQRFFWKEPSGQTIITGLGICQQIQSDQGTDRFFLVEKKWKRFIDDAVIFNSFVENGVGPLIFGGFSFDPFKVKTGLWSKFSDTLFHIPKYMLSVIGGQAYLTTNVVCTKYDDMTLLDKTIDERNEILSFAEGGSSCVGPELRRIEEIDPEQWREKVSRVVEDLKQGTLKKVVLARELRLYFHDDFHMESVLSNLLSEQQESFTFAFESNGDCFIGASPERLVKKRGTDLFSACLAGSIGRGKTAKEDQLLGEKLLSDQKNLIEHQYVVEMIKQAMAEICEEVVLPDQPQLKKMRDIQHLYTPVIGKAPAHTSLLALVERLHPTPALGGMPKKEAVEKIRKVEDMDRGFYAAPLGWMDYKGNGEFAVSIRSGLIQGKEASLFAGCGVVRDSSSESEYLETGIKFRPMLAALGGMEK